MIYRGPGFPAVGRFGSSPTPFSPNLPLASCLIFSAFLYMLPVELTDERGGGGGAKSYDGERAWPSINHFNTLWLHANPPPHPILIDLLCSSDQNWPTPLWSDPTYMAMCMCVYVIYKIPGGSYIAVVFNRNENLANLCERRKYKTAMS
jgi:hypothetical protein